MADLPRFADLFQIGARQILSLNSIITVAAVNRAGSDINIDVAAAAASGDECMGQLPTVAAGTFLDSSVGQALDRLIYDRYGLLRATAAPAVGTVNFQVNGSNGAALANPVAFAIPAARVLQTPSGAQLITPAAAVYPQGNLGPIIVPVQSVLAGANQQAGANTIASIVSSIPNGPASPNALVVSNPLATAGAADDEQDPAFRARARACFATARRGTLDAITQGALAVAGVQSAQAFELIDTSGRPARYVQLFITDAYTNSLANLATVPPTYQQQSQMLALNVFNALNTTRAGGINVLVQVAQVILQPVQLNLAFQAGANVNGVTLQARAAVVAYTNALQPGSTWSPVGAQAAVAQVAGLQITGNEIASPAGSVVPQPLQVIRTSLAIVSAVALVTGTVLQNPVGSGVLVA